MRRVVTNSFITAAVALIAALAGCKTLQQTQTTVNSVAIAAVAVEVQRGSSNPADWTAKAKKIKAIAVQLQAADNAVLQSLPAVVAALTPLIAASGLPPADLVLIQAVIANLGTLVSSQLGANPTAAQVQSTIGGVLTAVIGACAAYGA